MYASFLYLQYFLEKFYGEINDNTDFFQDSRIFSKIKRYIYSWRRNLLKVDKNRNCIFLSFFQFFSILPKSSLFSI